MPEKNNIRIHRYNKNTFACDFKNVSVYVNKNFQLFGTT